jgi:DNA-binding GntR family transcriptional regulator
MASLFSETQVVMPNPGATAAAHASLRGLILRGSLPSGAVLQDRKLADELGFSRTPIREALQRLEGEGLVERHGRVLLVASIGVQQVFEIFRVRQLLEAEAARAASERMSLDLVASIRLTITDMESAQAVSDDAHWQADDLLHLSIARESGNALLLRLIGELRQKSRLFGLNRIPSRFDAGKSEHLAILDALAGRDGERAGDLMRAHIGNARQAILATLTGGQA